MLTKQVTKRLVVLIMPKLYNIVFTLKITDDSGPGFERDFSVEFHQGDNVANKTAKIIEDMQLAINTYKAEQQILNSTAMNNAVTTISGGITL